jgi:hypothetical protein
MWLRWRCWSFDVPLVLYVNIKVQVSVYTENTYFDDRACEDLGVKRRVRRRAKKEVKVRMMDF